MHIGKIIYYHRKKQKKTQEQLCQGICSTTHLSKIENSPKEGNLETLEMLCNRLGISIEEENKKTQFIRQQLSQFYESIERVHRDNADRLYKELLANKDYIQCTEMIYLFELYILRYLLAIDDIPEFEHLSSAMKKNINKFSSFEKYLWEFIQGIYFAIKQQYARSVAILEKIEDKAELYSEKITDYYYYKAAMHGYLKHFTLSLHYSYKALRIFQNTGNILRIMHVKNGLAVNFIYINDLDQAEVMLKTVLNDAEMLKDKSIKISVLHNLGLLYSKKRRLQESLTFYSKCLQLKSKHTLGYYNTLVEYAQVLLDLKENEKAANLLHEALNGFNELTSSKYVELMVLYLEAIEDKNSLMDYISTEALPAMEKDMNLYKAIKYSDRLAEFFEEKGDFTSANRYLHLSNNLLKKLTFNDGKQPVNID
ncbi:helix-turn-helix transcriptional regulator [Cytobacillus oceanisediminis]|uniref:helix-turn-helix domain-containing protein n=1 Tax=Cytobacillus oceanisediminis TaxID=665099 RepID=UPI0023DC249D|nr:helix-turn-helix transcriptional regulator [Cytobacillus oceanisediminis]MDF2038408.1 helix-turn-helix transcriptional regulator [Cytobacillus oceanisediminis]